MKNLIAVKSCIKDKERGYHDVIRRTWGRDTSQHGFDLIFFMGQGAVELKSDEIQLNCPDDYDSLPHKTRAILKWSTEKNYDYSMLVDNDTFLVPEQLKNCGFTSYDFSGRFGNMPALGETFNYKDPRGVYPNVFGWPSGGIGYFVSKKAAEIVINIDPMVWAEDFYCGQCLGPYIQKGKITAKDLPHFECNISWHFPRRQYGNQVYDPAFGWQESMYRRYGKTKYISDHKGPRPFKVLVAVKSCIRDTQEGCNQAIRQTWGLELPDWAELKFFYGGMGRITGSQDEVNLPGRDDFDGLPYKTRAILHHSFNEGYEGTFLTDTDTYLLPNRWADSEFEKHDYCGVFTSGKEIGHQYDSAVDSRGQTIAPFYAYASTHGCYISKKAARLIISEEPNHYADDLWIGQVLGKYIGEYDPHDKSRITAANLFQHEKFLFHMNASTHGGDRKNPCNWTKWMHQMPEECR